MRCLCQLVAAVLTLSFGCPPIADDDRREVKRLKVQAEQRERDARREQEAAEQALKKSRLPAQPVKCVCASTGELSDEPAPLTSRVKRGLNPCKCN